MRYPCGLLGEPAGHWPFWRNAVHPRVRAAGRLLKQPRMRPAAEIEGRENARKDRQQNTDQWQPN
jgi:hypothetical protein